jgi:hypothetical protein
LLPDDPPYGEREPLLGYPVPEPPEAGLFVLDALGAEAGQM